MIAGAGAAAIASARARRLCDLCTVLLRSFRTESFTGLALPLVDQFRDPNHLQCLPPPQPWFHEVFDVEIVQIKDDFIGELLGVETCS